MNSLIIDNHYFGGINYYLILYNSKHAKIEQYERWEKASFRNRCVIATAAGMINLTVPVQNGRNQKSVFKDVKIDHSQPWQQQHWKTLLSAYNKSPFFEYYRSSVEKLLNGKHVFLFDLNLEIVNWVLKILKSSVELSVSESYEKVPSQEIADFRNKWLPKNFQNGELLLQYNQVFQHQTGFLPNLSILDLLFNEGSNTANLFRQQIQ